MLLAALDAEADEEVLKWLAVAVAVSVPRPRAASALAERLERGVTNGNARDWIETALARVAGGTSIGRARKAVHLLDERDLRGLLAKAWWSEWTLDASELILLAGEHQNPPIRRRAALILHRRGHVLPVSVAAQNLVDSEYLVREWTAHTQARDEARVLSREQLAERLDSERHPRVIEWLIPGVGQRFAADDDWVIARALANGDPGVLESAVTTFVPGVSSRGGNLARQLLEEAEDPVVLWRTIEHVSERPDVEKFGLQPALDKLASHEGFETIATELTLKGMSPATIAVIEKLSSDASAQRIFSALNGREREGVLKMLKEVPESYAATVSVVIALREELQAFFAVFGESYTVDRDLSTGDDYFQFTYSGPARQIAVYVACNDRKGLESATGLTSALVRHSRPSVVVSLGISGSLNSEDVPLGCVVVGETTEAYLSNSKVQDDDNGGYTLRRAGETYSTDTLLANRIRRLDLTHRALFARGESRLTELTGVERRLVIKGGPLAAGPSVVDSTVFREWMLEQQRDFKAVDMESAGVAAAAHRDGIERARLVVLRGISDLAAEKAKSDAADGGARRSSAMLAASAALAIFLEAEYEVSVWS